MIEDTSMEGLAADKGAGSLAEKSEHPKLGGGQALLFYRTLMPDSVPFQEFQPLQTRPKKGAGCQSVPFGICSPALSQNRLLGRGGWLALNDREESRCQATTVNCEDCPI